jgi:hypothetical protein
MDFEQPIGDVDAVIRRVDPDQVSIESRMVDFSQRS